MTILNACVKCLETYWRHYVNISALTEIKKQKEKEKNLWDIAIMVIRSEEFPKFFYKEGKI